MNTELSGDSIYYTVGVLPKLAQILSVRARNQVFRVFMEHCVRYSEFRNVQFDRLKILDFGTSGVDSAEANVLLRCLPIGPHLTCAGLDSRLPAIDRRPNSTYVQIGKLSCAADKLPFEDGQFDVVFCNAVLEHVGGSMARARLYLELSRISNFVFLSVPNHWFPFEHHTGIPLAHWFPFFFRSLSKRISRLAAWATPQSLDFLRIRKVKHELRDHHLEIVASGFSGIKLAMFSSNFWIISSKRVGKRDF